MALEQPYLHAYGIHAACSSCACSLEMIYIRLAHMHKENVTLQTTHPLSLGILAQHHISGIQTPVQVAAIATVYKTAAGGFSAGGCVY